jgi:hypothetical protein
MTSSLSSTPETSSTAWIVDRLNPPWATLSPLSDDSSMAPFECPVLILPSPLKEGDVIEISTALNPTRAAQERASIATKLARLSADDDGGDFSL